VKPLKTFHLFERSEFEKFRRNETDLATSYYSRGIFWFVFFAEEKNERINNAKVLKMNSIYIDYGD